MVRVLEFETRPNEQLFSIPANQILRLHRPEGLPSDQVVNGFKNGCLTSTIGAGEEVELWMRLELDVSQIPKTTNFQTLKQRH